MALAEAGGISGALFGLAGLLAQIVPQVPDDWKTWPVTAILGFITLVAIGGIIYTSKAHTNTAIKTAESLAKMAESTASNSSELKDLVIELRESNRTSMAVAVELRSRPCMAEIK